MKKLTRIFGALLVAASTLFSVTACNSTKKDQPVNPEKDFIQLSKKEVNAILAAKTASGDAFASLKPGKVYVAENLAERFTLTHRATKEHNQEGAWCARIYAQIAEQPFFEWLVFPGRPDQLGFRFIWFDKNGKIIPNAGETIYRSSMPGDPIRFSDKAPEIQENLFSFVVGYAVKPEPPKADKKTDKKADKKADAAKQDTKKADTAKADAAKQDTKKADTAKK